MSLRNAKVAIITRTRNRPLFLRRCLGSVAQQTFHNWLQIVVNDGGDPAPVDALIAALPAAQRARTMVIHQAEGRGRDAAANVGLGAANSEYVAVLDDDDTWHRSFLATCVPFLDEPTRWGYGGVATRTARVAEIATDRWLVPLARDSYNPDLAWVDFDLMLQRNRFTINAFVYRRDVQKRIGGYPEDFPIFEDWHFNLRFVQQEPIAVIPEDLANYHQRVFSGPNAGANVTATADTALQARLTERIRREVGGVVPRPEEAEDDLVLPEPRRKPRRRYLSLLTQVLRNAAYVCHHGGY